MTKVEQTEFYRTTDLAFASVVLSYLPDALEVVDKDNPRRVVFVFRKSDKLNKLVDRFWSGKLKVEPRSFFEGIKTAKAMIYSNEQS